jgi:hypothetical protein
MNTPSNAVPEHPLDTQVVLPAASATRPVFWSVRRELWENRSIYIAPLAAAAVFMFGFLISLIWLPHSLREVLALDPAHQLAVLARQYSHAAMLLTLTAFLVGIFYCLDVLHGERPDRSIRFWKSLPVSDLTPVLSQASLPLVVLPALTGFYVLVGSVALLSTAGDVRVLVRGGDEVADQRAIESDKYRFDVHALRMPAKFPNRESHKVEGRREQREAPVHRLKHVIEKRVAALSFFLGQQKVFPASLRGSTALYAPPTLVLISMIFWLVRAWFTNVYKRTALPIRHIKIQQATAWNDSNVSSMFRRTYGTRY